MSVLLDIAGVSKTFGGLRAVNEVSFTVGEGELVGLIGPNGAGKTTLFNLITGHDKPDVGRVTWRGEHIEGFAPNLIARRGLVRTFQNPMVFENVSVEDNLSIALSARSNEPPAGLTARLVQTCGLASYLSQKPGNLPYGVKRRLGIALALTIEPRLLLLDEPAAGLNQGERQELVALLRTLSSDGLTLVVVEHDMRLVMALCQRILVLDAGQLIDDGPPAQIQANPEVARVYLGKAAMKAQEAAKNPEGGIHADH
jgi:branched-chain amino acid transport system ATP-binding protein